MHCEKSWAAWTFRRFLDHLIAQPEGLVYYIFSCEDPNEVYSLGKQTLQYYLDNNLYGYMIDTSLEGLAEQMGVPADTLAKTVEEFNAHTKAGDVDEFGRTSWAETIEGPYYVAYQRKPARAPHHGWRAHRHRDPRACAPTAPSLRASTAPAKSWAVSMAATAWAATRSWTSACLAVWPAPTPRRTELRLSLIPPFS